VEAEAEGEVRVRLHAAAAARQRLENAVERASSESSAAKQQLRQAQTDLAAARREKQGAQNMWRAVQAEKQVASAESQERIAMLLEQIEIAKMEKIAYDAEADEVQRETAAAEAGLEVVLGERRELAADFDKVNVTSSAFSEEMVVLDAQHRTCKRITDGLATRVMSLREERRNIDRALATTKSEFAVVSAWYDRTRLRWKIHFGFLQIFVFIAFAIWTKFFRADVA
jgi:chromosome segregation ATPase